MDALVRAGVHYQKHESDVGASFGQWRARHTLDPEVDMATTVLDGKMDRFLWAALAQRIQGADAIKTE